MVIVLNWSNIIQQNIIRYKLFYLFSFKDLYSIIFIQNLNLNVCATKRYVWTVNEIQVIIILINFKSKNIVNDNIKTILNLFKPAFF